MLMTTISVRFPHRCLSMFRSFPRLDEDFETESEALPLSGLVPRVVDLHLRALHDVILMNLAVRPLPALDPPVFRPLNAWLLRRQGQFWGNSRMHRRISPCQKLVYSSNYSS
jgi:hypothetical protein